MSELLLRATTAGLIAGALFAGCGHPERGPRESVQAEQARRDQVEPLLRKTLDQLALSKYDEAERTIQEILERDPGNDEALKLRELSIEHRRQQAEGQVHYRRRPDDELPTTRVRPSGGPRPSADVVAGEQLFDEGRYCEAEACFRRALQLEPGNEEARGLLSRVQPLAAKERRRTNGGPWAKVRERNVGIVAAREPDWIRDYRQVLRSRKVTLNFPDASLAEVISFLQDVTGLNITVSPAVDQQEITVSVRLRDVVVADALRIILEQTQLAMSFENETLMITQPQEVHLELYDVRDLLTPLPDVVSERIQIASDGSDGAGSGSFSFESEEEESACRGLDADQLELIVTNAIGEDNWDDPASIEVHEGQLIVNQTHELHWKIRDVLAKLRRDLELADLRQGKN